MSNLGYTGLSKVTLPSTVLSSAPSSMNDEAYSGGNVAIAPALIGAGSSLLGGLLSALGGNKEEKAIKAQQKAWSENLQTKLANLRETNAGRYQTSADLSTIDPLIKKLFVGRVSSTLPADQASKYGINFTDLLAALGGSRSATGALNAQATAGYAPGSGAYNAALGAQSAGKLVNPEDIIGKYNMNSPYQQGV